MLLVCSELTLDGGGDPLPHYVRIGDLHVHYRLDEDEYEYVDDRFVILADTIIDKSRADQFDAAADEIARSLAADLPFPAVTLSAYFLIVLDKQVGTIRLLRDPTGIKTGYYCLSNDAVYVSTCVHEVAGAAGVREFNEEAVHQVLYVQYTFDGDTYYQSVQEVRMGNRLRFDSDLKMTLEYDGAIVLADKDNPHDFDRNQRLLRENTIAAHREYASARNVVLLSGGLDSAVMLGSLHELVPHGSLRAVAFRVKDTEEDETVYARSIADHLEVPLEIVTVDPEDPHLLDDFLPTILRMNNPYYGVALFASIPNPDLSEMYYAGQDTRLHTPDINPIDKFAFRLFFARRRPGLNVLVRCLGWVAQLFGFLGLTEAKSKWRRAIKMTCDAFDTERYILKYFFGCDRQSLRSMGVPLHHWDNLRKHLRIDLSHITNSRQLYNEIVKIKYREQYTDQIRYIQSLARVCGTYIALPFHNAALAEYCSSIPFDQATQFGVGQERYSKQKTIINKLLLRRAFRDKLNDKVYYRKKAVSSSLHLLFNGVLGGFIGEIVRDDLSASNSFLKKYQLERLVARFLRGKRWQASDEKYLYRVYYMAMLCIYNKHILKPNR